MSTNVYPTLEQRLQAMAGAAHLAPQSSPPVAHDLSDAAAVMRGLVDVCREIANDSRVDLMYSERRIRLYAAIHAYETASYGPCGRETP